MRRFWRTVGLGSMFLLGRNLFGSGFSIMELGARASGMGGAFTAIADDGSALFYNPAGISFQKGLRIEMDAFLVKGVFRFSPSRVPNGTIVPSEGYNGVVSPAFQFLGNMYLTKNLGESRWTAGFGMYAPFGLGDNWTNFKDGDPANQKFVGRFSGTRGILQNMWMQPTISYRLKPNMSVAFGGALTYTRLLLEQSILNPRGDGLVFGQQLAPLLMPGIDPALASASIARLLPEGRASFRGNSFAPGAMLGFLWKDAWHSTSLGVSARSPVTYHVGGKAEFGFLSSPLANGFFPALGAPSLHQLFPRQDISAAFTVPATVQVGIANRSLAKTVLSFDYVFQNYSRFKEIPLNFSQTSGTATPPELRFAFNFRNTYFLRAGWERELSDRTTVRAGYYFDHSAVPDATVGPFFPDSSKNVITAGASRKMGNKEITFFYQGAFQLNRDVDVAANNALFTNGQYRVAIHLFGIGLRLNKGQKTLDGGY